MSDVYSSQNRGEADNYNRYFAAMDKTMQQKLAFTMAHFLLRPGSVIADMGCGSGLGAFQYAQMNPHIRVIGIDISSEAVAQAQEKYKLPNLQFEIGDIESPDSKLGPFDGILNSSVLHHVYSFNNYDHRHVVNALKNQFACLAEGGTMIIRDFVAWPGNAFVILEVQAQGTGDDVLTMSDAELLILFSRTARPLDKDKGAGFFLEELSSTQDGWRRFRLSAKWANEFILRKDYRYSWDSEVLEEYTWWTKEDYARELEALGGRVVYMAPFWNSWIVENRFRGKIRIFGEDGAPVDFPPTNFIAVCEKVPSGESLLLSERAIAAGEKKFLKLSSYRDTRTGSVYDIAARPGDVVDYLPYRIADDGRLHVFAKHGYPRPLVNTVPRGTPPIDFKCWSGHMIEPLAIVAGGGNGFDRLAYVLGMEREKLLSAEKGLRYYSSPGIINECVSSSFVRVDFDRDHYMKKIPADVSGFSTSGEVRAYPAQDLLRAAQVGMLPEARLEANIYRLMQKTGIAPDAWLGGEMVPLSAKSDFKTFALDDLLDETPRQAFTPHADPSGYIRHMRSGFSDMAAARENCRREIEFVIPAKSSINVASILPLAQGQDGEIYAGLEERDLPPPQIHDNNSRIFVVPAFRLPQSVASLDRTLLWLAEKMETNAANLRKLGEGYFSSIGITPERVYAFVASVDPSQGTCAQLRFVRLRDLFLSIDRVHDAHSVISLLRAVHALGLWGRYTSSV